MNAPAKVAKAARADLTIRAEDPGTPDAIALLDKLSAALAVISGDSGRASFDPDDVRRSGLPRKAARRLNYRRLPPCRWRAAAFCACNSESTRSDAARDSSCASSTLGKYSGAR